MSKQLLFTALCAAFVCSGHAAETGKPIQITVDPHCARSIRGISELNRTKYFGLCDHGSRFDERCQTPEMYRDLVHENGITFGRKLGVVTGPVRWAKAVEEDPDRPGYINGDVFRRKLSERDVQEPTDSFSRDMDGRLDIAAHGRHNAFPEFMGKYTTPQAARDEKPQWIPENLNAAAELSAASLRYDYNDFDRPAFYEPVNEPHWSYPNDEHFAAWHLKTMEAVHRETPGVRVGGPCLSVAYFYGRQYRSFNGLKAFIDRTQCQMDFYSFHSYDYLNSDGGDFGGRITSGLPLESVLDLIPNYTVNAYGKEVPLVLSEHGGYGAGDLVEELAQQHFPGEGFEWEMKKRSIDDFNMVSSVLANTLVFMEHPHVVAKAVPFILLHAMAWDPTYYSVLYVPHDFADKSRWVPTQKILFYRFLRDFGGHRVKASCPDPDVQMHALVDENTLRIVLNNLSTQPEIVSINAPTPQRMTVRRLGRNADFTPYLTEQPLSSLEQLPLDGREAVLIKAEYAEPIEIQQHVDEIPCYGDRITVAVEDKAEFRVQVSHPEQLDYAVLRVGVSRPAGQPHDAEIHLNGERLNVPLEDCAPRLETEKQGYGSCKIIPLPVEAVRESNTVSVSFPDGGPGSVGAVVIRAGTRQAQ